MKTIIDNLERAEHEAKIDLNCVSKQALQVNIIFDKKIFLFNWKCVYFLKKNKENYEETLAKYNSQLQQNQVWKHNKKIRLLLKDFF